MSYSKLLIDQQAELEKLHETHHVDVMAIRQLQHGHFSKAQFDEHLDRLWVVHKRNVEEMETRHKAEQKAFLQEPDQPATLPLPLPPDISDNQDKAMAMLQRNQPQPVKEEPVDLTHKQLSKTVSSAAKEGDETLQKMMDDTRRRREAWKHRRGGHKR